MSAIKKSAASAFILLTILLTGTTYGHCDSVEGPVVKAAKQALESGNVNYILIWVQPADEQEISALFSKVMNVRKLNKEAQQLADQYFFESVVRIHRMGEGEHYTGLKPASYKPEEGIEAADIAVEKNSINEIQSKIDHKYHHKLSELFGELQSRKNFDVNDVKAGREYVKAYVIFIHSVEAFFNNKEGVDEHHKI